MNTDEPLAVRLVPELPVSIRSDGPIPEVWSGGMPVVALNAVLRRRATVAGSSRVSLGSYAHAGRLLSEFCALRRRSLASLSNTDMGEFASALLGGTFATEDGPASLSGRRGPRSADHILALVYSLGADLEYIYGIRCQWREYRSLAPHSRPGHYQHGEYRRLHRIPWAAPKVLGLPDDQLDRLIRAAWARWGTDVADGDRAHAADGEAVAGALFWRNLAILMVLRYAGARRSEVATIDVTDIDRERRVLHLVTKGRLAGAPREPVLLHPHVEESLWTYLSRFRPIVDEPADDAMPVFVSHSLRNYGERVTAQTVRKVLDALRPALDEPWRARLHPHALRHAFGYDLQRAGGDSAVLSNMRHRSLSSGDPYRAGAEQFAIELGALGRSLGEILGPLGIEL